MTIFQSLLVIYLGVGLYFAVTEIYKQLKRVNNAIKIYNKKNPMPFKVYLKVLLAVEIIIIRSLLFTTLLFPVMIIFNIKTGEGNKTL